MDIVLYCVISSLYHLNVSTVDSATPSKGKEIIGNREKKNFVEHKSEIFS